MEPGERTGNYRLGGDQLLTDPDGASFIRVEDYAVALVDELEKGDAIGRRSDLTARSGTPFGARAPPELDV